LTRHQINDELGAIRFSDEVVSAIAGLAASEIEGVAGMSGGFTGGIVGILSKKNLTKGIKVEVGEKEAVINLYLAVYYETYIPDVALQVQENVKETVENMTGLEVSQVNINVQGVAFKEEEKK